MVAGNGADFAQAGLSFQRAIECRNAIRRHSLTACQKPRRGAELASGVFDYLLRFSEAFGKTRTVHQISIGHDPDGFRFEAFVIGDQERENRIEEVFGLSVEEAVRVLHTLNELLPTSLVEVHLHRVVFAIEVLRIARIIHPEFARDSITQVIEIWLISKIKPLREDDADFRDRE